MKWVLLVIVVGFEQAPKPVKIPMDTKQLCYAARDDMQKQISKQGQVGMYNPPSAYGICFQTKTEPEQWP